MLAVRDRGPRYPTSSSDICDEVHREAERQLASRDIITFSILIAVFTATIIPYISFLPDIAHNILGLDARGYELLASLRQDRLDGRRPRAWNDR